MPSDFIQSASVPQLLPHFTDQNNIGLPAPTAIPRIWIGNAITVAAHYDISDNIACVVGGRRRFTFFPPEHIANLYVGPIHFTPAAAGQHGVARAADLRRYPRFQQALAVAQSAELEAGRCGLHSIFLVASRANRWSASTSWSITGGTSAGVQYGSPYDCLLHGFLTLRHLPARQRAAWRAVFDHYVFQSGADPVAHLPPAEPRRFGPHDPGTRSAYQRRRCSSACSAHEHRARNRSASRYTVVRLGVVAAGCTWAGAQQSGFHDAPASSQALANPYQGVAEAQTGRELYGAHCASCHGASAQGSGTIPPLAHSAVQTATDGELFWFITTGSVKEQAVPSWSALPEQQRWQIVTYLKTLTGVPGAAVASAVPPIPIADAPPPTPPFTDFRF